MQLIIKEVTNLLLYFDTVHIFCTVNKVGFDYGDGNLFARQGQINLWVKEQEKQFNCNIGEEEEEEEEPSRLNYLKNSVSKLLEHFETVQIFCTKYDNSGTYWVNHGKGNHFTRYGQALTWLKER